MKAGFALIEVIMHWWLFARRTLDSLYPCVLHQVGTDQMWRIRSPWECMLTLRILILIIVDKNGRPCMTHCEFPNLGCVGGIVQHNIHHCFMTHSIIQQNISQDLCTCFHPLWWPTGSPISAWFSFTLSVKVTPPLRSTSSNNSCRDILGTKSTIAQYFLTVIPGFPR